MDEKYNDYDDSDGESKPTSKHEGASSPRKRLMQAKLNADAIETEVSSSSIFITPRWIISVQNSKVEAHKATQVLTKSFVKGIIDDGLFSLTDSKQTSKWGPLYRYYIY